MAVQGRFDGLSRFLVRCHPPRWRERYAAEVLDLLDQHQPTARTVFDLYVSAVSTHLDPAWRGGRLPRIRLRLVGQVAAVIGAILLFPAAILGCGAWKEMYGPPMPISDGTWGMAFSPDARTVAVIGPGLEIWSVGGRAHPKLLNYSHGDDNIGGGSPAFSPDGRMLATAGGSVTLWNVTDPARFTQIALLPQYRSGTNAVAFSPDGRVLAGGLGDGRVVLWDITDPVRVHRLATLTGQKGNLTAVAFSPDGRLLASASPNGTVFLWDVADLAHVTRIAAFPRQPGGVPAVAFSPDGRLLASGSDGGTVILRNVAGPAAPVITATLRFAIPRLRGPIQDPGPQVALAFSADGRTLSTIAGNTTVTRWNVSHSGAVSRISSVTGHTIGPGTVAFAAGGSAVAGAPATGETLALWKLP